MPKTARKAWNGGTRDTARAASDARRDQVLAALKDLHRTEWDTRGIGFQPGCPFRHPAHPGWLYLPIEDMVILDETARHIVSGFVETGRTR